VRFSLAYLFSRNKTPAVRNEVITGMSMDDFVRMLDLEDPGTGVTAINALEAVPVQACVALIAGGMVSMPLTIVRREVKDGTWVQQPADDHPLWWLLNEQPNEDSTAEAFWSDVISRRLLNGRAYARIVRAAAGRSNEIRELVFHPNEQVQPDVQWDGELRRNRIVRYVVRDGQHTFGVLPEDMLDFRAPTAPSYLTGPYSMSRALWSARQAVGLVTTIEKYCAKFFANGGMPRTILKYPQGVTLDKAQQDLLRDAWVRRLGGPDNAALPFVLQSGGDAVKLSFNAEEAQMLEARKFQVIDIARAFGVPAFMIGETEKTSAWGTGIEHMSQGFIRYTLGPHITGIEQELNRKLFGISRYFVDYDEEALARGDMKSLGDWFRQAVGGSQGPGFMKINEVRRRLKLPPDGDAGDTLYVPTKSGASSNEGSQSTDGADGGQQQPSEAV
jgi:HK97 family phage portal protein